MQFLKKVFLRAVIALALCQSVTFAATESGEKMDNVFFVRVKETVLCVQAADNSSAKALVAELAKADIRLEMDDYGGFEKVGELPQAFPRNDHSIQTQPGDVILYQGRYLSIYYDRNSWSLTWLGKVRDRSAAEIKKALGRGRVEVTLSLKESLEK